MVVSTPLRPQDNGRRLISAAVGKSLLQAFYDAFCELVRKFLHKAIEQASAVEHAGLARQRDHLDFDVDSVVGFLEAPVEVQAPEVTAFLALRDDARGAANHDRPLGFEQSVLS